MDSNIDDALRRAAAAHRIAMERALAAPEITPAQFAVLEIVASSPGVSSAELARMERLTPPTLSVIVGNLERKGALVRRPHANNARIQCLEATDLGRESLRDGRRRVEILRKRIADAIPDGAAPAIDAWLRRVAEIEV
jgi:DNA-binding MarR family transcriptional regulator